MQEPQSHQGKCFDCGQGVLEPVHHPFNQYIDDDGEPRHWYCTYCGSNHVQLHDTKGHVTINQGNLYIEAEV